MKWSLSLDDCKQACIDEESCTGFVFTEPQNEEDQNCLGKTAICGNDEYEVSEGSLVYVLTRGM